MSLIYLTALGAFFFGLALSIAALWRKPRSIAQWSFAAGLVALSMEAALLGFSLNVSDPQEIAHWQRLRLLALAFVPGPWLTFSLSYARGNAAEFIAQKRPLLIAACVVPMVLCVAAWDALFIQIERLAQTQEWFLTSGWAGAALNMIVLVSAVMVLMNLERTFRASIGTMRWRIKFMIMGVGLLFAVRLYIASQSVVYSGIKLPLQTLLIFALWLAGALIGVSFWRAGLFHVDVYPSQSVIRHSITVLLAGVYLLLVGVLANVVAMFGGDDAFSVKALLVLVSLVGLGMLLLSDRIQERIRRFVSRHFQRPHYDYRRVWSTFTERTASLMERAELSRAVVQWVAENFNALSVTIWLADELQGQLVFGASTALPTTQAARLLAGENTGELIQAMAQQAFPVDLDTSNETWVAALKRSNPEVFTGGKGGNRVCVPLVAKGQVLGLLIGGDRVNGMRFTLEDMDLLKCIGDQVAGNLLNIQLSQKLLTAKELEAFQTMSAFFVHDLKNTASTLSLMLQNLPAHFADPAFREDALRGLGKSVTRINELITRLGALRQEIALKTVQADINQVVTRAMESLTGLRQVNVSQELASLPKLQMDPDQVQKVVVNLLVNALEAVGEGGQISVRTHQSNNWAVIGVTDNGCGMSPDFISKSLFRPFQTTKKKGIGIGMFLSKSIIEAHRGKIEVESLLGKGSTFRILLPLSEGDQ